MKAVALALFGAALSLALSAASQAQNYDNGYRNDNGPSINVPLPNFGFRHEQQAQGPSDRNHDRYCEDLRQRAENLRDDRANADDRQDAERADNRLDQVRDRLARDCND